MNPLSRVTILLGSAIILSASFVVQVRNYFAKYLGEQNLRIVFFSGCLLVASLYMYSLVRRKTPATKLAVTLLLFLLAYLLMEIQQYFAEKVHVLEYGILGYLACRDCYTSQARFHKAATVAMLFISAIALLDEGFQFLLPYRVFEFKDVGTNVVSGMLGITQCNVCRHALQSSMEISSRDLESRLDQRLL